MLDAEIITNTSKAISSPAGIAHASEWAIIILACSMDMTVMHNEAALINI